MPPGRPHKLPDTEPQGRGGNKPTRNGQCRKHSSPAHTTSQHWHTVHTDGSSTHRAGQPAWHTTQTRAVAHISRAHTPSSQAQLLLTESHSVSRTAPWRLMSLSAVCDLQPNNLALTTHVLHWDADQPQKTLTSPQACFCCMNSLGWLLPAPALPAAAAKGLFWLVLLPPPPPAAAPPPGLLWPSSTARNMSCSARCSARTCSQQQQPQHTQHRVHRGRAGQRRAA